MIVPNPITKITNLGDSINHPLVHYKFSTSITAKRIPIPNRSGVDFVSLDTILYCHSDGNLTWVFLEKNKFVVSRNLKQMEALLSRHNFIRIHHQYLVNANHIVRYERGDGGCIRISTGDELPVSRDGKKKFMEKLKDWV